MRVDTGRESGAVICRALGLDPDVCTAVDIHWRAGEVPYARVELCLNEEVVWQIVKLGPHA